MCGAVLGEGGGGEGDTTVQDTGGEERTNIGYNTKHWKLFLDISKEYNDDASDDKTDIKKEFVSFCLQINIC